MEHVVEHSGVVERVAGDVVFVTIVSEGACSSCRAREACGMGEAQQKSVAVRTPDAAAYSAGEAVTVGVESRTGGMAVILAYVGALVTLLALLVFGISVMDWNEGISAVVALLGVAAYYGVLRLARPKIENRIHFTIIKR